MLTIYGSTTSPFVRRVRIVAADLKLEHKLFDSVPESGQAAMRKLNPLWKVPTIEWRGGVVFDSHVIVETLWHEFGGGSLRPYDANDVEERNTLSVIDGALDSAVNVFYMKKDGVDITKVPYLVKQRERVDSAMTWLNERLRDGWFTSQPQFGYAELVAFTTFEWFRFREVVQVERWPRLASFTDAHHQRFFDTRPMVTA